MGITSKLKLKMKRCVLGVMNLLACGCCFPEPTREQVEKYYGQASIQGRKYNQQEHDDDVNVINHLTALTEGESVMNLEKILRHKDQWLSLADMFGVIPSETDLSDMEAHLGKMK